MKNRKQMLADFYLDILSIDDKDFNDNNIALYDAVLMALSNELKEKPTIVLNIFERMASEDSK